jgi:Caspase domain
MKQALIVVIDKYPGKNILEGCEKDARELAGVLETNADGSLNFEIQLLVNPKKKSHLQQMVINLFNRDTDIALFYFSGHGYLGETGSYLVTPDLKPGEEGVSMEEILHYANESDIRNKIIILDCCHSGAFGALLNMKGHSFLRKGLTILTASRDNEAAMEVNGEGLFTSLLLQALKGGAADLKGDITPGSVYTYIDQAIGSWGQRPVFKANITRFTVLRKAKSPIAIEILKQINMLFLNPDDEIQLDESFENNQKTSNEVNIKIFDQLKALNRVGVVIPSNENNIDMYWAAMKKEKCKLTELGKHYWRLVVKGKI